VKCKTLKYILPPKSHVRPDISGSQSTFSLLKVSNDRTYPVSKLDITDLGRTYSTLLFLTV
jgi:hypothetical protein